MSITPNLPLVAKRASVLHGSVLDANHPNKWVSFGCKLTIYISERLYEVLKRRYDNRDPEITYVFHTRDGRRKSYSANTARRIFNRVGLNDCSYHTLRHTLASKLIQNGLNIYEVKEILGHTDIKTTMRYAHLEVQDVSRKAKAVLDGMRT